MANLILLSIYIGVCYSCLQPCSEGCFSSPQEEKKVVDLGCEYTDWYFSNSRPGLRHPAMRRQLATGPVYDWPGFWCCALILFLFSQCKQISGCFFLLCPILSFSAAVCCAAQTCLWWVKVVYARCCPIFNEGKQWKHALMAAQCFLLVWHKMSYVPNIKSHRNIVLQKTNWFSFWNGQYQEASFVMKKGACKLDMTNTKGTKFIEQKSQTDETWADWDWSAHSRTEQAREGIGRTRQTRSLIRFRNLPWHVSGSLVMGNPNVQQKNKTSSGWHAIYAAVYP